MRLRCADGDGDLLGTGLGAWRAEGDGLRVAATIVLEPAVVGDTDPDRRMDAVARADAESDRLRRALDVPTADAVGLRVGAAARLLVVLADVVFEAEVVLLGVAEPVAVRDADTLAVLVTVRGAVLDGRMLSICEGEPDAVCVGGADRVCDTDDDVVFDRVAD